ncbi:MAG: class I tRNA ligase family protein, partial [Acidimicrobiales bacterium]|nr:class I tRNA ligase family protein [Acidimicrobiales bacterium]
FLQRVWRLGTGQVGTVVDRTETDADIAVVRAVHRLIAKVSDDFDRWSYNTAVAACMELVNELYRYAQSDDGARTETIAFAVDTLTLLLAPMAPHLTAELWFRRHDGAHVHEQAWPVADPAMVAQDTVTMVVQVNGKVRDRLEVPADIDAAGAEALALGSAKVQANLDGRSPRKVISRPPNLVNIVA